MANEFGKRPHKGIRTFSGPEATNVILGQGGFDILVGTAAPDGTEYIAGETTGLEDVRMWVALKAVEGADAEVQCVSAQGDDFAKSGTYVSTTTVGNMTIKDQDVINGCFTTVRVTGSAAYILAYRG
jgi:hypothetical protein